MEQTLKHLYETYQDRFKLSLIAGKTGLDTIITWVHLIEDVSTTDFIRGNEIIISTGLRYEGASWLKDFITALIEKNSKGLILNTGMYIHEVPQKIIDYCNRLNFPLFTMPWEIHLEDIMQSTIYDIIQAEREEVNESVMIISALTRPDEKAVYMPFFHGLGHQNDHKCSVTSIRPTPVPAADDHAYLYKQMLIEIQNMLHRYHADFSIVKYRQDLIILFWEMPPESIRQFSQRIMLLLNKHHPLLPVQMVVGPVVQGPHRLHHSYSRSMAAMKPVYQNDMGICFYEDLGLKSLLFEIDDENLLLKQRDFHLGSIIDYDHNHGTEYLNLLRLYIENDCSINAVAQISYTHRNTVNYRMNKIRSLLPLDLSDPKNRLHYLMAFYIMDHLEDH